MVHSKKKPNNQIAQLLANTGTGKPMAPNESFLITPACHAKRFLNFKNKLDVHFPVLFFALN